MRYGYRTYMTIWSASGKFSVSVEPTSNTVASQLLPPLYIFFKPAALRNQPSSLFIRFFDPTRTMSDNPLILSSNDSSSDEVEVKQMSTSLDSSSSNTVSSDGRPPWSCDKDLEEEEEEDDDDDGEPPPKRPW